MKKIYAILLAAAIALTGAAFYYAPVYAQSGGGTISTLDQWKSDGTNITQRTASKPLKLTGLESLNCLGTNASGVVGLGSCSGGGGSTFGTTSLNASAPLNWNTTTATLTITQAGAAANGYLSSTDWNIFNNKISSTSLSAGAGISYNSTTGVITNTIGYPFPSNATTTALTLGGLTITGKSDGCATFASGVLNSTGIACGSGSGSGLSTSSPIAAGNVLAYNATGAGSAYGVATGTVSGSNGLTVTAGQSIIGSGLTITGVNAAADGSTKGVSAYTASDFDAASGVISLDYTNGQKATNAVPGFLSAANWQTFNMKLATSAALTAGQVLYATTNAAGNTVASAATGTISGAGGVTVTAGQSVIGSGLTVTCTAAGSGATGCLSNTDWSLFNNKISSSSLSGTAPITYSSATGAIGCNAASGSQPGCLSSADWTTFNSKSGFAYPFNVATNATSTKVEFNGGLTSFASTTIGAGATTTGLTISGNSTTTGVAYFAARAAIGTSTPYSPASLTIDSAGQTTNSFYTGSVNSFLELNVQNRNAGSSASSDFVATADNGTATTHYINLGINGSGGGGQPFTTANHAYLFSVDDALNIGALGASAFITFNTTGGVSAPVERGRFAANGNVGIGATTTPWGRLSVDTGSLVAGSPSFVVGSSTRTDLIVDQGGKVGIGTTTPGTILSVQGVANFHTATSTFQSSGGISLTSGCFAIGSTCVGGSAGTAGTDVQTFEVGGSSTWNKPTGAQSVDVICIGGGGGGGRNANASAASGGGGGGGGRSVRMFPASILGSSETVTAGAGGTGATTASAAGGNGTDSTFGAWLRAGGGGGGGGDGTGGGGGTGEGAGSAGVASASNGISSVLGGASGGGGNSGAGVGKPGGNGDTFGAAGGGGGAVTGGNLSGVGGNQAFRGTSLTGGTAVSIAGTAGNPGTDNTQFEPIGGSGGSGGAGNTSATGGKGGKGGRYGGGGGGGGSGGGAGGVGGNGGDGGAGFCAVITHKS